MVHPVIQALLLAEHVYKIQGGGFVIANTLSQLLQIPRPNNHKNKKSSEPSEQDSTSQEVTLPSAPEMGSAWIYLRITSVCRDTEMDLQFVDLDGNNAIFGTKLSLPNDINRLDAVELAIPMPRFPPLPTSTYALEVICDGAILASHKIKITSTQQSLGESDHGGPDQQSED